MPKVLVVDDSTSVRKVLERLLAARGLQVVTAQDAEEGLKMVTDESPDLVIADVVMPGMSGFELCQLLRLNQRFRDTPVILISGIMDDKTLVQAQSVGASGVISKPFTPDTLYPKIEQALSKTPAMAAPAPAPTSVPAPAPEPTPAPPVATAPTPSAPEPLLKPGLEPLLSSFLDKPEVETALVIGPGGAMLGQVGQMPPDPEVFTVYCRTLFSIAGVLGERSGYSTLDGLTLEYRGHQVVFHRINTDHSLVLVVRGSGQLGVLRYLVQRQLPQIVAHLA
jgi:CheY-like chemotaxis protein/predicted regulator of Ras-like GTPase activity (Roadblock/LC7/MglB family)